MVVCRELTKLHEEVWRGTLAEAAAHWGEPDRARGEVTLVVGGADAAGVRISRRRWRGPSAWSTRGCRRARPAGWSPKTPGWPGAVIYEGSSGAVGSAIAPIAIATIRCT